MTLLVIRDETETSYTLPYYQHMYYIIAPKKTRHNILKELCRYTKVGEYYNIISWNVFFL